jgi:hypothetical protein
MIQFKKRIGHMLTEAFRVVDAETLQLWSVLPQLEGLPLCFTSQVATALQRVSAFNL